MSAPLYIHRYRLALRDSSTVARASSPDAATTGWKPVPQLRAPITGNAVSTRRVLEGFLIRSGDGFGCVHPWPELGDPDVSEMLAALREGKRHRLLDRALACAVGDGAARREGRSLFTGVTIPRSHATITGDADFPALAAAGFTAVKLKTHGSDPALPERVAAAAAAGLKVRIDCNGTGTAMLAALHPWADSVDFIEDPEPYEAARWREIRAELGLPLALDRLDSTDAGGYDVRVLKPALESCEARAVPVVFTSYMDHPVGQMWAALAAARYEGTQLVAGLLTHLLFEPDAFTEAVRAEGPQLLPPGGTGLGFDALLEALPWERLSGAAAVDCGSLLPLSGPQPAAAGCGAAHQVESESSAPPGSRLPAPQRQQAAAVHGGGATDVASAEFWQSSQPLLLMNPRTPVIDPPPELPDGCLVFATSGSTGTPSLVCLSREAMLANAASVNTWLETTADDIWLRVLPVFHVGGVSIHARAFLSGSRVVCDEGKWDPTRFVHTLEREGVTLTSVVPAQVFDLVAAGLRAPATLRVAVVGGGALSADLYAAARTLGWPLLPGYGMTEASSQVATVRLESLLSPPATGGPQLELLPCWEARLDEDGRLQLRGAPLLSGWLKRTTIGWEFRQDVDAGGWFTTSDRVALNGRILSPLGRCDRVVKVLGELVDLDAIEAALAAAGLPPERGAVIALRDERAGVRPWLVTDFPDAEAVVATTNATLAPFARIEGVRRMELPRSPLGKVLRNLLP